MPGRHFIVWIVAGLLVPLAAGLGGFHLGQASQSRIDDIIAEFRRLGVRRTAPCHCTGDRARRMFADAFGADFIPTGVGGVITVGYRRRDCDAAFEVMVSVMRGGE